MMYACLQFASKIFLFILFTNIHLNEIRHAGLSAHNVLDLFSSRICLVICEFLSPDAL